MSEHSCILYADDLFDSTSSSTNEKQLDAIFNSGFTTVVLWAMHVQQNGDLHYNNTPMVSGGQISSGFNPSFGEFVSQLKNKSGSSVKNVLFSIGGSGVGDYASIKNLLESGQKDVLLNNFAALLKFAPDLDGFDFDLEETPYDDYSTTVPALTQLLHDNFNSLITFCPYQDATFWINCLKSIAAKNGRQLVEWMNLQVYGVGADPDQWAVEVQNDSGTGVKNGDDFISAGYSAQGSTPSEFCRNFQGLKVTSGFVWNLGFIDQSHNTPTQYAQAIRNGLNQNCS